jgi:hypothetical protein
MLNVRMFDVSTKTEILTNGLITNKNKNFGLFVVDSDRT